MKTPMFGSLCMIVLVFFLALAGQVFVTETVTAAPIVIQYNLPTHRQTMSNARPVFEWGIRGPSSAVASYTIQVSKRSDFQSMIVNERVLTESYRPGFNLPEGKYHWRVLPLDRTGKNMDVTWSNPVRLTDSTVTTSRTSSSDTLPAPYFMVVSGDWVKPSTVTVGFTNVFLRPLDFASANPTLKTSGSPSDLIDSDPATGLCIEYKNPQWSSWRDAILATIMTVTFPEGIHLKGLVYDHAYRLKSDQPGRNSQPVATVKYIVELVEEMNGKHVAVSKDFDDLASGDTVVFGDNTEVKSIRIEHSFISRSWPSISDPMVQVLDIYEIRGIPSKAPTRPRLLTPVPAGTTTDPTPVFKWEAAASATPDPSYSIEIANNPLFAAPFVSQATSDIEYTLKTPLPPGVYFWRVVAKNQNGDRRFSLPASSRFSIMPGGCVYQPDTGAARVEVPPWFPIEISYSGAAGDMIDSNSRTGYRISAAYRTDPKVDAVIHTDFKGSPALTGIFYENLYQLNNSANPDPQNSVQMDIFARNPGNQGRWEWLKVGDGRVFPPMIVKSARIRHTFTVWGWGEGGGTSVLDIFEIRGIDGRQCLPPEEERLTGRRPAEPETATVYVSKCPMAHPSQEISPVSFNVAVAGITFVADTHTILNGLQTRTASRTGRLQWIRRAALWHDADGDGEGDRLLAQHMGLDEEGKASFSGFDLPLKRNVPDHLVITHDVITDGLHRYDYSTNLLACQARLPRGYPPVTIIGLPTRADTITVLKNSNRSPEPPRLAAPADRAESVPTTVTLHIHPFTDPDGDSRGATQWQVADSRGLFTNASMIAGIVAEAGNCDAAFRLPRGLLKGGTRYTWRVRVSDHPGAWSDWSDIRAFTTGPEALEVIYKYDTVYVDVQRYDTVYVDRPVDRIVNRYDTVYVDRPVDRIVNRYDTVYLDRPVDRIVNRYDTVYVDRPVDRIVNRYDTVYVDRHHYDTVYVDQHHHHVHEAEDDSESKDKGNNGIGNGGEVSQGEDPTRHQDTSNPGRHKVVADERLQFSMGSGSKGSIRMAGAVNFDEEVSASGKTEYPSSKFRYGLFTYNLEGVPVGGPSTLRITLPENVPSSAKYMLWNPATGWMDLTPQLGSMDGDNTVELTLFDGGPGDLDGIANGTIVDPGGFMFPEGTAGSAPAAVSSSHQPVSCVISNIAPGLNLSTFRSLRDVFLSFEAGRVLVAEYYRFSGGRTVICR